MKIKQTIGMLLIVLSVLTIAGAVGGWEQNLCTFTEALSICGLAVIGAVIGWFCGYEKG